MIFFEMKRFLVGIGKPNIDQVCFSSNDSPLFDSKLDTRVTVFITRILFLSPPAKTSYIPLSLHVLFQTVNLVQGQLGVLYKQVDCQR